MSTSNVNIKTNLVQDHKNKQALISKVKKRNGKAQQQHYEKRGYIQQNQIVAFFFCWFW